MVSRERRAPVCEHADEFTVFEAALHLLFGEISKTKASSGRVENERGGVEDELAFDPNPQVTPVLLEFPSVKAMARQAKIDAIVGGKILRRSRRRVLREIGR